ncbi:MAG: hypothetical protein RR679_14005, partial [Glutamicibacter sp.]
MHSYVRRAALMLPILLATAGCQAAVPSDDVLLLTPALPETLNPLSGFGHHPGRDDPSTTGLQAPGVRV